MDKTEFNSFYAMLTAAFPNEARFKVAETRRLWWLCLEPYAYDQCKAALLDFLRKNKKFVDPADITAGLVAKEPEDKEGKASEREVLQNIHTACAIMGWAMPGDLTAREAVAWYRGKCNETVCY